MAELLCAHPDLSSVGGYVHVLMRCGWPGAAHYPTEVITGKPSLTASMIAGGSGLIADHPFALPLAPDDMPAELREPLRRQT